MIPFAIVAVSLGLVAPPVPCGPIPSERQLARLRLGMCGLVHLGIPTFLARDVATESDDRSIFRIEGWDASPWVADIRAMGLDGLVLVVRNDDGFRLAETAIVPALAAALADAKIPMGISVGRADGVASLPDEVADLCRRFGPFFEVRLGSDVTGSGGDGRDVSCGNACIVSAEGPDFSAAAIGVPMDVPDRPWRGIERAMSLRPSWHWRLGEDERLRGVDELEEAWFASVGRGEPLLLGIPADRDGRLPRGDVDRVVALRRRLAAVFDRDLARDARVSSSSTRENAEEYGPGRATDGIDATFWATDDGTTEAWLELAWNDPISMNIIELREPERLGIRCDRWTVEARLGTTWTEIADGDAIGFRRLVRFPTRQTDAVRIRLVSSGCGPALAQVGIFAAPPEVRLASAAGPFRSETVAKLESDRPDARILYSLDGRDPAESGAVADGPITIDASCLLRAVAVDASGRAGPPIAARFTRADDGSFLEATSEEGLPGPLAPGLALEWHEGVESSLEELAARAPRSVTTIDDVALPAKRPADRFALVYRGFLRVPEDGLYTFALRSDDGSRFFLHDRLVVDRDGPQVYDAREGRVGLRRGLHPIRVEFCEFEGRESLSLWWSIAGGRLERIPADAFAR